MTSAMKDPAKEHVVVVGRGIAGAMTAWRFHKRGCDVRWWGDGSHAASRVAAGMYNPVSFRHVVEVWNAKHHVAAMKALLEDMQQSLGLEDSLFDDVPVMRIFPNDQSREDWDARIEEGHGVAQWIGRSQEPVGHVSARTVAAWSRAQAGSTCLPCWMRWRGIFRRWASWKTGRGKWRWACLTGPRCSWIVEGWGPAKNWPNTA